VRRAAVDGLEVDAGARDPEGHGGVLELRHRGVRDGDAVLHARGHGLLARDQRAVHRVAVLGRDLAGGHEAVRELADGLPLVPAVKIQQDGRLGEDLGQLHGNGLAPPGGGRRASLQGSHLRGRGGTRRG
jgi:hypothetical protein